MGTTMRATSGAGTVNTPGELEVTAFSMVRVAQSLVCYAVFCRQLFVFSVLVHFTIVFLRFEASDCYL
jgi:hypothetical protein